MSGASQAAGESPGSFYKLEFLLVANWDNTLAEWNSPTGAIAGISETCGNHNKKESGLR